MRVTVCVCMCEHACVRVRVCVSMHACVCEVWVVSSCKTSRKVHCQQMRMVHESGHAGSQWSCW